MTLTDELRIYITGEMGIRHEDTGPDRNGPYRGALICVESDWGREIGGRRPLRGPYP